MELFHTSPEEITKITENGLFDDCLFFSEIEYSMGHVEAVYSIEIENSISVSELYDEVTINHIATVLECTEENALEMLTGEIENAGEVTGDCEDDWFIQAQQGKVAKLMGYEAAEAWDEQGTVYIVPMLGREKDLKRIK